jgi:hypothetical protein
VNRLTALVRRYTTASFSGHAARQSTSQKRSDKSLAGDCHRNVLAILHVSPIEP